MKSIGKALGIVGIIGSSFLPMKSFGQDVLEGHYTPRDYSKLNENERDSLCQDFYKRINSVQNERIFLYSQANSYLKKHQNPAHDNLFNHKDSCITKADSLVKSADFYLKLRYGWLKEEADEAGCNFVFLKE